MKYFILLTGWLFLSPQLFSQCQITYSSAICGLVPGSWAQGFTATCNGYLSQVGFIVASPGTVPADTLRIYSGNGTNTLIYSQYFNSISTSNSGDSVIVAITGNLPIILGSQYTFEINSGNVIFRGGGASYTGGDSFLNGAAINGDNDFIVEINSLVAIDENDASKLSIGPNPTIDKLFISLEEGAATSVTIRNSLGQLILSDKVKAMNQLELDLSLYPTGIYYLQLEVDGQVITKKIVKK
ncbi:MAG: T9SS type A sorting domain-containing protein [Flavobacteriales bacterium]|nr:T9SS type A sorting domain-containing protein [Flavobacteriales bacterium]